MFEQNDPGFRVFRHDLELAEIQVAGQAGDFFITFGFAVVEGLLGHTGAAVAGEGLRCECLGNHQGLAVFEADIDYAVVGFAD